MSPKRGMFAFLVVFSKMDGHVPVLAHPEGDAAGGGGVDEARPRRGDDGVGIEDVGQPAQAEPLGQPGEGPEDPGEGDVVPPVGQGLVGQRPDEHHLQQQVDGGPDEHGEDHRPGHVPLRVLALATQLHRLLESDQGEHRPTVAHRVEDAVQAEGGEATAAGEVGGVEMGEEQYDDGQGGDEHLPDGDGVVGPNQVADAEQVGHHEQGHHRRRHQVAGAGQHHRATYRMGQAVPVVGGVGDGRLHLDGGGAHRLQP